MSIPSIVLAKAVCLILPYENPTTNILAIAMTRKENSTFSEDGINGLGARLRQVRREMGLNQSEFGELLGFSGGYISEVEQGKKLPGTKFMASLKRASGRSIDWVLTGEMRKVEVQSNAIRVPLYLAPISAGQPTPPGQEPPEWFELPSDLLPTPRAFMITVAGDSMIGAGIRYGDVLVVDPDREPKRGEIVVAVLDGETTVKRLEIVQDGNGRHAFLYPENELYSPIEITGREVVIQGVVKGLLRSIKGRSWRD